MKAFNRTTIALFLSLAILFLTIGSAAAEYAHNNIVVIRGPVYDGSDIDDILAKNNGGDITMDASQFAAFYINTNDDTNELLSIKPVRP